MSNPDPVRSISSKSLFSKPIGGAVLGLLTGMAFGIWGIWYVDLADWLSRVCFVASMMLVFQLLGTTIGATIGKPSANPKDSNPGT